MMLAASSPYEASRIYQGMGVLKMYQLGKGMPPLHNLLKAIISLATYYTSRYVCDWPKCFCIYRLKCSKALSGRKGGLPGDQICRAPLAVLIMK